MLKLWSFDEYGNYCLSGSIYGKAAADTAGNGVLCSAGDNSLESRDMAGHKCRAVEDAGKHKKSCTKDKRNRKLRRLRMRLLRVAVVMVFLFIIYLGYHMVRYIVWHSLDGAAETGGFGYRTSGDYTGSGDSRERGSVLSRLFSEGSDSINGDRDMTEDWRLILVNKNNAIPENYEVELTTLSNGVQVDSRIYPDLQRMFDDMRNAGIYPTVGEGYRTRKQQETMMQDKIDAYMSEGYSKTAAKHMAKDWVAKPGTSEHELGIAVDINASADSSTTHEEVYQWLYNNAYRYGFILRYPEGREDITGIDYEPWHYRYVGEEAAKEIYESGLTLEEYVDR